MQTCPHSGTNNTKVVGDLSSFQTTMSQRILYLRHNYILKEVLFITHTHKHTLCVTIVTLLKSAMSQWSQHQHVIYI